MMVSTNKSFIKIVIEKVIAKNKNKKQNLPLSLSKAVCNWPEGLLSFTKKKNPKPISLFNDAVGTRECLKREGGGGGSEGGGRQDSPEREQRRERASG